jgi:hypothetical protein
LQNGVFPAECTLDTFRRLNPILEVFMNRRISLAVLSLLVSTLVLAQSAVQNHVPPADPAKPLLATERHPQAGCLAGISRERLNYAGAIDLGIQKGLIDPKQRPALEKIHSDLMALETRATANRNISNDECKGIYKKIVAESTGLQMQMRASPFKATRP